MRAWPLIWTDRLDARPADLAKRRPWPRSVRIGRDDLASRTHELPSPGQPLWVLDDPDGHGRAAVEWLRSQGRSCHLLAESEHEAATVVKAGSRCAEFRGHSFRLWRPAAFLEQELSQFGVSEDGAVDMACGTGRDAVYLASAGWRVTGMDLLDDALRRAAGLYGNSFPPSAAVPPAEWARIDLESDPRPTRRWGLAVSFRFLHRPLLSRMHEWVVPGGRFIGGTFTTEHRARHGKPSRDAHLLDSGELLRCFDGWRIERYEERWRDDGHLALIHARR